MSSAGGRRPRPARPTPTPSASRAAAAASCTSGCRGHQRASHPFMPLPARRCLRPVAAVLVAFEHRRKAAAHRRRVGRGRRDPARARSRGSRSPRPPDGRRRSLRDAARSPDRRGLSAPLVRRSASRCWICSHRMVFVPRCHRLDQRPQLLERSMQPDAHGARLDAEHGGDFLVRHAAVARQHDQFAPIVGQPKQRAPQTVRRPRRLRQPSPGWPCGRRLRHVRQSAGRAAACGHGRSGRCARCGTARSGTAHRRGRSGGT